MEYLQEVNHNNLPQMVGFLINEVNSLKELLNNSVRGSEDSPYKRITIKQICEEYQISKGTIHNRMNSGELRYEKVGRKTLFKRIDVEACFNTRN